MCVCVCVCVCICLCVCVLGGGRAAASQEKTHTVQDNVGFPSSSTGKTNVCKLVLSSTLIFPPVSSVSTSQSAGQLTNQVASQVARHPTSQTGDQPASQSDRQTVMLSSVGSICSLSLYVSDVTSAYTHEKNGKVETEQHLVHTALKYSLIHTHTHTAFDLGTLGCPVSLVSGQFPTKFCD